MKLLRSIIFFPLLCALVAGAPVSAAIVGGETATEVMPALMPGPARAVALFLSGDAGWSGSLGRASVQQLRAAGIAVIGLDSRQFFNRPRSAAEVAAWLDGPAAREGYVHLPLILIGQSFGADALLPVLPALPAGIAQRLRGVALLVPGTERYPEVSLGEFLGLGRGIDNRAAGQAAAARLPLLCVQGAEEPDSLCPILSGPGVERVTLPGGHMLRRDDKTIGRVLTAWATRVLAGP